MTYRHVKRYFDVVFSLIGLILLFPFFLLVAIAIKLESPDPVIFTQERVGLDKQTFRMYKFRTMYENTPPDTPTAELDDVDQYVTKVGRLIRKGSIDELPQLLNIVKGEMSLIGPRPVISKEEELIEERFKRGAYEVLPGLTGLSQINGRDHVSTVDKAELDAIYVKNMCWKLDLKIFFHTIWCVLKREGVVDRIEDLEKKATSRVRAVNTMKREMRIKSDE